MCFSRQHFRSEWEATDAVYLKEDEIPKIYKLDLSHNSRLDKVKDLFVFGCFVGLRYADYSDIKPKNIVELNGVI